jgi:putative DNA methylase
MRKMCATGISPPCISGPPAARRPLAACRAALIATLLPDPEDDEERKLILEKLGGKLVQRVKKVKGADGKVEEKIVEETEGGILHWGRESGPDLEWFRQKIREAYGGQAPKVLDPFAGGGAIPLEAMRLGCEATAIDINPVAWFILKCTLEYPQKLAGQTHPLPDFAIQDRAFMEQYLKAQGYKGKSLDGQLEKFGFGRAANQHLPGFDVPVSIEADLAWHVRAWGRWVLAQARRELARFYPTYADFEPLVEVSHKVETRPMQLVPLKEDGTLDLYALNSEFDEDYLKERRNPRWVAKPTVAYLWARTVTCKNCRATIPLLKTRWLTKKDNKLDVLTMEPNSSKTGVVFGVLSNVPKLSGTLARRHEYYKQIGGGTMSRSGATCPCCGTITTMEDIRLEGQAGRLRWILTVVAVDGLKGKEYRLPTELEVRMTTETEIELKTAFSDVPFGIPEEPTPVGGGSGAGRAFSVQSYGLMQWKDLFTLRQLLALGTFVKCIRNVVKEARGFGYATKWAEAIIAYLTAGLDRLVDFCNINTQWKLDVPTINHALVRFAIQITWDFAEGNPIGKMAGSYLMCLDRVAIGLDTVLALPSDLLKPNIIMGSATEHLPKADIVVTDPPYYDSIPYSDLMDWFYVWLRRSTIDLSEEYSYAMNEELAPKWDQEKEVGELIDDSSRHDGNAEMSKRAYEDGMAKVFKRCAEALVPEGKLVVVFANKQPDAWETLVSSVIRSGFVVTGSWPIQTEQPSRTRGQSSAALSSSIWLVAGKRPETTRPSWDNRILDDMREKINIRLRDFWDAGIRGPDFVWAATGPALEAYSKYPAVKKANEPGQLMTVGEFLRHVRRMVVDFVVGRVLTGDGGTESVSGLDDITTYYLLHRHDFGFEEAPAGACILYAISCGLSDRELADRYDLLTSSGKPRQKSVDDESIDEEDQESEFEESSGSTLRLKGWKERKSPNLGMDPALDKSPVHLPLFPEMESEAVPSRSLPLIDQVHRLMHLWKAGDVNKVDDYLDIRGLRRNQLFHQLLQALIELAPAGSEERALLESISNHIGGQKQSVARLF